MKSATSVKACVFAALLAPALSFGAGDAACLSNCHGEEAMGGAGASVFAPSLYVDGEKYSASVHGAAGLGCVDCHPAGDYPGSHPGLGVKPGSCRDCHAKEGEGWDKTAHGLAGAMDGEKAPGCADCHTAHYVAAPSSPDSPVGPQRLALLCLSCHDDLYDSGNFGVEVVRWRLKGHAKGDLGESYDPKSCLSCHQGEGAHGEADITGQSCPKCHLTSRSEQNGEGFHFQLGREATFLPSAMTFLYPAGVAAALIMALYEAGALFMNRRRRKKESKK